jgi:secreted Zn-dependent insulinase-like peptidase
LQTTEHSSLSRDDFFMILLTNIFQSQETTVKDYQNFNFRQPHSQASFYVSLILEDKKWPVPEKLEALSKLESDSLAKFLPNLLSKTFLECYIQGLADLCTNNGVI